MIALLLGCRAEDDGRRSRPVDPEPPTSGDEATFVTGGPASAACPGVTSVAFSDGPVPPSVAIRARLGAAGAGFAICEDDAGEQVLAEGADDGAGLALSVPGLRGGEPWTCTVHAACGGPARGARVVPSPSWEVPDFSVEGEVRSGVWTAFNTQQGTFDGRGLAVVVDPAGDVRWALPVADDLVADLDVTVIGPDRIHVGGGWGVYDEDRPHRGVFRTVDLDGTEVVARDLPDFGLGFNHHSQPLPDGSYLSITGSRNEADGFAFYGVGIERWHPDEGVTWTFDSQSLLDAGDLPPPVDRGEDKPYHANAARWVDDRLGAGLWVSLYGAKEIWRVDRDTGRLHSVFGAGGDYALVDASGAPLGDEDFPWVQHDPEYTDEPDGLHVLVYDNGQGRPTTPYSRVAEFVLHPESRVAELRWGWTEDGWSDPITGDADWLPTGDVLVTRGFSREWRPDSDGVSQILELTPPSGRAPGVVRWRLRWPDGSWATFRSQRVDGCGLFRNARYCPAVAARVGALLGG